MIDIVEELPTAEVLEAYSKIPISYPVDSIFRASFNGKWILTEEAARQPFVKNYDDVERPLAWAKMFDLSKWRVFSAFDGGKRVGGTVLAFDTPGVEMLEGRSDIVVMWDLRIHPDYRREAIGSQLFEKAIEWGRAKGCRELKVETQDINVHACKFYTKMGCELRTVRPGAYPGLPNEVKFLWYRPL